MLVEWEDIGRSLSFDLQGWNESLTIKQVHVQDENADPDAAYHGPEFSELAEDVQESFYDYLDDRLVTPEFATWLTKFSYYKELQCYGRYFKSQFEIRILALFRLPTGPEPNFELKEHGLKQKNRKLFFPWIKRLTGFHGRLASTGS